MIEIPPGKYRYEDRLVFVKYPYDAERATWHVWGPANMIAPGKVCEVYQYSEDKMQPVEILKRVGYRMVKKRDGGRRVKYVLASFDKVVEEASHA